MNGFYWEPPFRQQGGDSQMMAFDEEDGARAKKEEAVLSVETCVRTEMSTEERVTLVAQEAVETTAH